MKKQLRGVVVIVAWLAAVFLAAPVSTASDLGPKIFKMPPGYADTTDRLIVKFRDPMLARAYVLDAARVQALGTTAGIQLRHLRPMSDDRQVFEMTMRMPVAAVEDFARQLAADPAVEYAEPDRVLYPLQVPNDSLYASQLDLHDSGVQPAGINMPAAWDITTGDASIVTAVIDTGIVPHADIDTSVTDGVGRLVKGYDFISPNEIISYPYYVGPYARANDGNGRDANPTDAGDWVAWPESYYCGYESDSSWHGTHVAGTIGALANNATGIAGINWTSRIQPIRVLGKCGGYLSDISDAIQWAAGASVPLVPVNATPARVINLSLGGYSSNGCGITMQAAIDKAVARGAVVVVAAGNDGQSLVAWPVTPAICNNVITVAAVNQAGGRASYSNYGTTVEIAAPGGGDTSDKYLYSTLNSGLTRPLASPGGDIYERYGGTSMATPHVAGVASLMLSLRPNMKPSRTLAFLKSTARTFPTGTGRDCTTSTCGAGVLNASAVLAAVNATVAPVVNAIASSDGTGAAPGTTVTMTGTATVTAPAAFLSHTWVQTAGPTVTLNYPINTADTLQARFTMPSISPGIPLSFRYTFTDDVGMSDNGTVTVVVPNPVPTLASVSPAARAAGSPGFTLTVNGTKFVKGVSTVYWNGTPLTTTFVSTTQLTAKVLAVDVAAPGVATVTVVSPGPGGGITVGRTVTITGPTITSLSPLTKPAGSAAFTLVVNGTSFVSGVSKVYWNGAARTTTFVSATQLKASIPATDVAAPGTAEVTVTNPPSGGTSAPVTFTIRAPAITTLSPASGPVGKAFTLTVNGSSFLSGVSKVYWNGSLRTTTFVSATQLKASIPATDVAALGTADVTVMNGASATSNTATFTIGAPAITSLSPLAKPAGSAAFTLVVNGTGFVSGASKVYWNGALRTTTFVSATQVKASITAADLASPGTAEVTVTNLPSGGTSAPASFTIAAPTITTLNPATGPTGKAFTLVVNGTNFVSGVSKVYWNGSLRTTTFVSPTQLKASILAADVPALGTAEVTVRNGTSATSNIATFTISAPTITSLSPLTKPAGSPLFALVVNGTNFVSGVSKVYWNGALRTTTFVSPTQLKASILAADIAAPGSAEVTVTNLPSGGTSAPATFTIAAPTITTLNPATGPTGKAFTLVVNGSNFVTGVSKVYWNGALRTTTFVSATQLKASILASDVPALGTAEVTVMNGASAPSNTATFTISAPTITSLSPLTKPAGSAAFTLVVNGTGFVSGVSKVYWNGALRTTTFVSSTQLKANILATDVISTGTAAVTVTNLPTGGTSDPATFTIAFNSNPAGTTYMLRSGSTLGSPSAVVDRDGNRAIVWDESNGAVKTVYMSRYVNGGWESPAPILSDLPIDRMAIRGVGAGDIIAVWAQRTSPTSASGGSIQASSYTPASGWSAAAQVASYSSDVSALSFVNDGNGNTMVVWSQREGPNLGYYNLWSSHKTAAGNWSPPELRETALYDVNNVRLGIDDSGNVTAIWGQGNAVYYARYNGSWTAPASLASNGASVDAAVSRNGDIVAAWTQYDSGQAILYLRRFTPATGWDSAQPYTTTANSVRVGPYVAINDSGNALVAWHFAGGPPTWDPLKAIRYTAGSGWGSIAAVDDNVYFDAIASLTLTNGNDGLIVRRDGNSSLVTYGYREGSGWGGKQIFVTSSGVLWNPGGSINLFGAGVQVWREQIDANYYIRARLY